ncbi:MULTISPECIES: TIGR03620 family F420-dependent LLM class oxidoreductase [unclassified Streptomyces]|uniref:TIGR03620 family F420-dependent LLM class oxidoreductase n=1 Tax=unclassified Streptomyces TaxID=2593676 RepID=UPI002DDA7A9C|nr:MULTISPECIES: TIGR03620 family F420-dependent LLM class oxidoreductase [unclassified Streptomyces]WSB76794.1 TIGR03620 family F420-dependent LLM class oxidoreductase [Streptomyces sp. NBC_01775]WSS14929.1 TIGR03620 family F420-dependent LLM class oxidoreductase [Streptomyces sp. NBC_01186]WSS43772.1 TIGR03620 family F420-dependent LLM class oxidoreductase [Streptomyces sp. NBC_01187]
MAYNALLGRVGIWAAALQAFDPARQPQVDEAAAELDELGYGALWIGGSPSPDAAQHLLSVTSRAAVGTSILSIWDHAAPEMAARHAQLTDEYKGRFILGLGVSHEEKPTGNDYRTGHPLADRPYSAMRGYLDVLDNAPRPVPAAGRALAALGPRMLELARERSLGALPYLITPQHTAEARDILGADPLLAPELKAVLVPAGGDRDAARDTARDYLGRYLGFANYRNSWLRLGFTEADFEGGGSDRLIDAVYAIGTPEQIRARVDEFLSAGADHVALQVVTANTGKDLPLPEWRILAETLPVNA